MKNHGETHDETVSIGVHGVMGLMKDDENAKMDNSQDPLLRKSLSV